MASIHNVQDILSVQANWIEKEPKCWMISSIHEVAPETEFPVDSYPDELKAKIEEFDAIVNGVVDGTVTNIPDDLIDFESQDLTENQYQVLKTLMTEVPRGEIISYKDLGIKAGLGPNVARFIGNTMHINYWPIIIPCHRVVKSDYTLGNYSLYGPEFKVQLLLAEGIKIENNKCYP